MSHKLQPVRGTHDILPDEAIKRRFIFDRMANICATYGYGEIATPVFEFSDVFHRTLGDTSDVVTKETYTFTDRGGDSLTLRPEFTASVVRAFISNSLQEKLPFKVFYHGPAFRYERPQKGRLRQFTQFGAELLGANDPASDAEMIAMAMRALESLGLRSQVTLHINSLGDADSRKAYREALVSYFNGYKNQLSDDSKMRLEKNPLRILDSKDEGDRRLISGAPKAHDYFTPGAAEFFARVKQALGALGVEHVVNERLVRGLDYYNHTVFEFITDSLGAQGTVLAGGRYDGLVKQMGGQDIAGIGFAAGIERLLALMEVAGGVEFPQPKKPVAIVPVDDAQEIAALMLADQLRRAGLTCELVTQGNMGKKMKRAERTGAEFVLILGESEVAGAQAMLKRLSDGSQQQVAQAELERLLKSYEF